MKVSCNVELTPKEARELMGLPDMEPFWEESKENLTQKVTEQLTGTNPVNMFDPFGFSKMFTSPK